MTQGKTEVQLELDLETEDEMFSFDSLVSDSYETQLHNVVLDNDNLKSTITAMESYMYECAVLIGWKDNKDKYL